MGMARKSYPHDCSPQAQNMETDPSKAPSKDHPEAPAKSFPGKAKQRLEDFYNKYEKYSDMAIFGVGFIWDSLTMTRVDSLIDNVILLFYQILIGTIIILALRRQKGAVFPKWLEKIEPRFHWIMQFCFGGLFSSYVIFYFKSSSFTRTQFFFLILVCLWIGNEFLRERLNNRILLSILYSFCLFSFFAFFLPVVLARVNAWIFVLAGLLSILISLLVFSIGLKTAAVTWRQSVLPVVPWIIGVFLLVNSLYFANMIPPVPLALKKNARIYHNVTKTSEGYEVQYVPSSWLQFWKKGHDPFYLSPGESVYCFTSVFAPRKVHVPIYHVWSKKTANGWTQTDRIRYEDLTGGREGGFRIFTRKREITPGKWRVEVQTESEQILGRKDFTVVISPDPHPALRTELIP